MKGRALVLAAGAALVWIAQVALKSQSHPPAATSQSPARMSFRLAFTAGDAAATRCDGSIQVSGGRITKLDGWHFSAGDRTEENRRWQIAIQTPLLGAVPQKGVIVGADAAPEAKFQVATALGNFSFTPADVPFGPPLRVLGGRAEVERVPNLLVLAPSDDDQDYPALAGSGDDVYLAYIEFSHPDRELENFATMKKQPANFDWLARPAGGDRVKLMRYAKAARRWSAPEDVSPPHEDCMRASVAVDGRGRVWVIWSANRGGNFDLYARYREQGRWSREFRLTTDRGTDVNPVAASDSAGHVWVAWQAYRGGNLEILVKAQKEAEQFTAEQKVSFSSASDWDPAIAAGPHGEIAVTWDTYEKGDYDVYARTMRYAGDIAMDSPMAVAASRRFEARSSAAYDPRGRLWIAYETSAEQWGKDFGAYEENGVSLYSGHSLHVKCFAGGRSYEPVNSLEKALRSVPGRTGTERKGDAVGRNPGKDRANAAGPRNSFPRIATDASGRVYLSFRSSAGVRALAGTIWQQYLTWLDGSGWSPPLEIAGMDGLLDIRPAMLGGAPAGLLIAGVGDRREPFAGRIREEASAIEPRAINADLIVSDINFGASAAAPELTPVPADVPAAPTAAIVGERRAIDALRAYRLKFGGEQFQLLRGEFHRHTEYSKDGGTDGPLVDAYRYLIDAARMDWGGCCDHDNGDGREYAWWTQQKLTDAYYLDTSYIPMFSYERSVVYPEGHRNVVFARRGTRPLPRLPLSGESAAGPAPDTQMLYGYLRQFDGIAASHTSATGMGTDWRDNDPMLEPVVEIYQGDRQNYEMPGAPRAPTEDSALGGWRPLGFVSLALQKGYRLGFEASSDHVSTHMSYCNLWVKDRSRDGIMEAFRKRRIYGATDNILADVRCGNHFMGEEFTTAEAPTLQVHLVGTAAFASVNVIRDGSIVYTASPKTREVSFVWRDSAPPNKSKLSYYYIRGEQQDGQLVWVSPLWIHRSQ
jgi:hypothetical protein